MHFILILLLFVSCRKDTRPKQFYALPETVDESITIYALKAQNGPVYPWLDNNSSHIRPVSKEYFRCRGSSLNPPRIVLDGAKEVQRFYDCSGSEKHSLPLYDGKEHIYPILIELLNEIQKKTNKPVIITSGHRCPQHQAYIDSSPKASGSKHQVGAQVTFYVQGMENNPECITQIIFDFYKNDERYSDKKDFIQFNRYEKESDVSTPPWFNKEIFIKIYKSHEGRDFDNRHPYPYLSVQVRHDLAKNESIQVSYAKVNQLLRK